VGLLQFAGQLGQQPPAFSADSASQAWRIHRSVAARSRLRQLVLHSFDLVLLTILDERLVEDILRCAGQGRRSVKHGEDRPGDVQAQVGQPVIRPVTRVAFSVEPSSTASGCMVPWMPMPRVTTQVCSPKCTPRP
jgi:hypothetical protein